jgi:hypothetical protein
MRLMGDPAVPAGQQCHLCGEPLAADLCPACGASQAPARKQRRIGPLLFGLLSLVSAAYCYDVDLPVSIESLLYLASALIAFGIWLWPRRERTP